MARPPSEIPPTTREAVSEVLETPVAFPPSSNIDEADGLAALATDNPAYDVTITFAYTRLRVLVYSLLGIIIALSRTATPTVSHTLLRQSRITDGVDAEACFERPARKFNRYVHPK